MIKYFFVSNGLRGCYMPDSVFVIRVNTRKALKEALEAEASSLRDAGYFGLAKRRIASLAADAWREAHKARPSIYDFVAPCSPRRGDHSYALACSVASRRDYDAHQAEYA